jgi:hypothetical protein
MTSWIHVSRRKSEEEKEKSYLFQTEEGETAAQFTSYLYAQMFSKNNGRILNVYDKSSLISANFELIRSTFADVSGVQTADSILPTAIGVGTKHQVRLLPYLSGVGLDAIRSAAATVLQWKPAMLQEIEGTIKMAKIPTEYDFCVHLRGQPSNLMTNSRPVSVATYVQAANDAVKSLKLGRPPVIFVLSEGGALFEDFKKRVDVTWKLHNLGALSIFDTRRPSPRTRMLQYTQYLTELYVAQRCPLIISSLSSPTGRFLYLTCESVAQFRGLDTNMMTFY